MSDNPTAINPSPVVQETFVADGEQITAICNQMEDLFESIQISRTMAIAACLSLSVVLMDPDIDGEKLSEVVRETSRFICMSVSPTALPATDGNQRMN